MKNENVLSRFAMVAVTPLPACTDFNTLDVRAVSAAGFIGPGKMSSISRGLNGAAVCVLAGA